jgi:hypothetical protein
MRVTRSAGDQDDVRIADPAARKALLRIGCAATDFF